MNKLLLTIVCCCLIFSVSCSGRRSNVNLSSYNSKSSYVIYDKYSRISGRVESSPAGGFVVYDKNSRITHRIK
jgi:hypothetical protein